MNFWDRLTRKYTHGSLVAEVVLNEAYRAVFYRGGSSQAERQMVLSDLAARCGFYQVAHQSTPPNELMYREGRRAAFAEIFSRLSLSGEDMRALENASRYESAALDAEG